VSRNRADRKAHLASARATARRHPEPMLVDMPGWQQWKVGHVLVIMPKLLAGTPSSVRRAYRQRIIANATGECPRCNTITTDPHGGHASPSHDDDCPVRRLQEVAQRRINPRAHNEAP
jgi:hypothetical protein